MMDNELYLQLVVMNSYLDAIVTKLCGVEVDKECLETANDLAKIRRDKILASLDEKECAREETRR